MTAVLIILLILVGLPLLAWWVGSRRAWSRVDARGRDQMQAERAWIDRHGLTAFEQADVDRAVNWGRAMAGPRLRAAAVERANMVQESMGAWERSHPRWTVTLRWLRALWVLLLVTAVVFGIVFGDWSPALPLYVLAAAGSFAAGYLQRRNLARAVELNRD